MQVDFLLSCIFLIMLECFNNKTNGMDRHTCYRGRNRNEYSAVSYLFESCPLHILALKICRAMYRRMELHSPFLAKTKRSLEKDLTFAKKIYSSFGFTRSIAITGEPIQKNCPHSLVKSCCMFGEKLLKISCGK